MCCEDTLIVDGQSCELIDQFNTFNILLVIIRNCTYQCTNRVFTKRFVVVLGFICIPIN